MNALDVYLHAERVGTLERHSQAKLRFTYAPEWVPTGRPLSLSLPLRVEPFSDQECAPFFAGLLPEGEFLKAIARAFHVSAENPFALLTEIGGECAGAVSLAPAGAAPPGTTSPPPRWLSKGELAELLASLPQRPLLVAIDEDDGIRLSLAGTNDKLGVAFDGSRVGLSRGMPPSTHILKTPIAPAPEAIANEAFCMALAALAGLDAARAQPHQLQRHEYLLVERYDRDSEAQPDGRIHQEDLCQALGFVPGLKYESEGGPNVAGCVGLLRAVSSAPARDLIAFLDALLFNLLIGNHDAHSKNYSLLLEGAGSARLAPLYDLISTSVYDGTSRKLAMKYGGEYRPGDLRGRHLDRLAADLQVKPSLLRQRGKRMIERACEAAEPARMALPGEFAQREVLDKVIALISERAQRLSTAMREA